MFSEHLDYLTRVSTGDSPVISREVTHSAFVAWYLVWEASDRKLQLPAACTGPNGTMFYSWDKGRHHLELEILPNAPAEFFYRDRETENFWGEDYKIGWLIPSNVVAAIQEIAA